MAVSLGCLFKTIQIQNKKKISKPFFQEVPIRTQLFIRPVIADIQAMHGYPGGSGDPGSAWSLSLTLYQVTLTGSEKEVTNLAESQGGSQASLQLPFLLAPQHILLTHFNSLKLRALLHNS